MHKIYIPAGAFLLPKENAPAWVVVLDRPVALAFDPCVEETAFVEADLPDDFAASSAEIDIHWSARADGGVVWEVETGGGVARFVDTVIEAHCMHVTAPVTVGMTGKKISLKVSRKAADPLDTVPVDATLSSIEMVLS